MIRRAFAMIVGLAVWLAAGTVAHALVGGTDISKDPLGTAKGFVVTIEARRGPDSPTFRKCLGAAVTPEVVLTAAHCLADRTHVVVKFITNPNPLKYEAIQAASWRIHADYDPGLLGSSSAPMDLTQAHKFRDIAVILLKRPAQNVVPITAVPLDFEPSGVPTGSTFYAFGHGRNDIFVPENTIRYLTFQAAAHMASAEHWYVANIRDKSSMMCEGDSGAPVTISAEDEYTPGRHIHYLVGIQTTVAGKPRYPERLDDALQHWKRREDIPACGRTLTFIDIRHHVDWIREQLSEMDPENPRDIPIFGNAEAAAPTEAKSAPGSPRPNPAQKRVVAMKRSDFGECFLITRDHVVDGDAAIDDCSRIISRGNAVRDQDRAYAHLVRGFVHYKQKDDGDQAFPDFSAAIRLDPKDSRAYRFRGMIFERRGEYDSAIADHDAAIRLDPEYYEAYFFRGLAYFNKGDADRAIADFDEAIRFSARPEPLFYNYRGQAYAGKGDYDRAIADYGQAIRIKPQTAEYYNNRGAAYVEKGFYDRAIVDLNKAISLNSQYALPHRHRGRAYLAKGDVDRAFTDFDEAIRLLPEYDKALRDRGLLHEADGDLQQALKDLTKYVSLKPDDPEGRAAVKRVQEKLTGGNAAEASQVKPGRQRPQFKPAQD